MYELERNKGIPDTVSEGSFGMEGQNVLAHAWRDDGPIPMLYCSLFLFSSKDEQVKWIDHAILTIVSRMGSKNGVSWFGQFQKWPLENQPMELDKGKLADVVHLDFQKAFNKAATSKMLHHMRTDE
eukprot:g30497.t1